MEETHQGLGTRIVDHSASTGRTKNPLSAPRSSSLRTDVSNLSARAGTLLGGGVKDVKRNVAGLFSRKKAADASSSSADSGAEADGAFNSANREYDPSLFSGIRDAWVRRHLQSRMVEYTTHENVRVAVLTWNVAAKKPPPAAQLHALFARVVADCALLVIGLQEAVELSASNVGAGAAGPIAGSAVAWETAITKEVLEGSAASGHGLRQVVCRQMMGIVLLVYVRKELQSSCSVPRTCSVGTGLLVSSLLPPARTAAPGSQRPLVLTDGRIAGVRNAGPHGQQGSCRSLNPRALLQPLCCMLAPGLGIECCRRAQPRVLPTAAAHHIRNEHGGNRGSCTDSRGHAICCGIGDERADHCPRS